MPKSSIEMSTITSPLPPISALQDYIDIASTNTLRLLNHRLGAYFMVQGCYQWQYSSGVAADPEGQKEAEKLVGCICSEPYYSKDKEE